LHPDKKNKIAVHNPKPKQKRFLSVKRYFFITAIQFPESGQKYMNLFNFCKGGNFVSIVRTDPKR
jgi:hypothetical protein